MGREKKYFRDILEDILNEFDNHKSLSLKEVAQYLNVDVRTAIKLDLPFKQSKKRNQIILSSVALAKWLSD